MPMEVVMIYYVVLCYAMLCYPHWLMGHKGRVNYGLGASGP